MSGYGSFVGDVVTKWLKNTGQDRDMVLLADFEYIDQHSTRWVAEAGDVINGASIPPILWGSVFGSPFVGSYRRATVLHDVYCEKRTVPSPEVHQMFFYAMLCDGVSWRKAYKMYKAVDWFGPQWGVDATIKRSQLIPSYRELDQLECAIDKALAELGEHTPLEELDRRVSELLADDDSD